MVYDMFSLVQSNSGSFLKAVLTWAVLGATALRRAAWPAAGRARSRVAVRRAAGAGGSAGRIGP